MTRNGYIFFKYAHPETGNLQQDDAYQEYNAAGIFQSWNFYKNNSWRSSEYIQYLFFGLFQFVFHLYHAFLDGRIISFGARGIDLSPDFLEDK